MGPETNLYNFNNNVFLYGYIICKKKILKEMKDMRYVFSE